jgi:thymidylate kinase
VYIIEGPDGVGKSTLAKEIAKQKNAHVIHSSFNKSWDIKDYHIKLMTHAKNLEKSGIPIVLDRWAPSEQVYGDVFRGGPRYGIMTLIRRYNKNITWIYCRNDNTIKNHLKHLDERHEMFDDMTIVVARFDKFIKETQEELNWITYDYDKNNKKEFVEDL